MNKTYTRYHAPCAPSTFSDPIPPAVMQHPGPELRVSDYRGAVNGDGPLAGQWADKPHRLVYDLCNEVLRLRNLAGLPIEGQRNA